MAIWLVVLISLLIAALLLGVTVICAAIAAKRAKAGQPLEEAPAEAPEQSGTPAPAPASTE